MGKKSTKPRKNKATYINLPKQDIRIEKGQLTFKEVIQSAIAPTKKKA